MSQTHGMAPEWVERRRGMSNRTQHLQLGSLSAIYHDGDLRYLTVGGIEIVRRVGSFVRDTRWGTVAGTIHGLQIDRADGRFDIRFQSDHRAGEIDCVARVAIHGRVVGPRLRITYGVDIEARSTFRTNRAGICLLHPIDGCAGEHCQVEHVDGSVVMSSFPREIAPHQIFRDVRALSYGRQHVRVRFDGNVFETEDQRNWADTSFKTYCRPLSAPAPYLVERGTHIVQSVEIEVDATETAERAPSRSPRIEVERQGAVPEIGTCVSSERRLSAAQGTALKGLHLSYVRVDVRPSRADFPRQMNVGFANAVDLGVPVELAVHLPGNGVAALSVLLPAMAYYADHIERVILYREGKPLPEPGSALAARDLLRGVLPGVAIGIGTVGNFAELNRNRGIAADVIAYAVCPQVHATDDLSLIENLASQGDAVTTTRKFAPNATIVVGPVSLARQPDPFAAGLNGSPAQTVDDDARHRSRLGAAWVLGSIKYLAEAGAAAATYFDAVGPLGLVSEAGRLHPVAEVIAALARLSGCYVRQVTGPSPLVAVALAVECEGSVELFLANLQSSVTSVQFDGVEMVELPPYAVRRLGTSMKVGQSPWQEPS